MINFFKKVVDKNNVGQGCQTNKNILLNTEGRSIIVQGLRHHSPQKAAFTLAEVLITLGVIGVVAALTLPNLIQNYQKHIIINRLKVNYNILSNAIRRAEAENGPITEWPEISSSISLDYDEQTDKTAAKTNASNIVKKYIVPYLNNAQLTETTTLAQLGYKRAITYNSGETFAPVTASGPILRLNNGTIAFISITNSIPNENGKKMLMGMNFYLDVDGPNGQNIIGKDVFEAAVPYTTNTKFIFMQDYRITNATTNPKFVINSTRSSVLESCKTTGRYCGALIQMDGWQIKNDYPW